jgi:hypothetical protein
VPCSWYISLFLLGKKIEYRMSNVEWGMSNVEGGESKWEKENPRGMTLKVQSNEWSTYTITKQ